MTTVYLRLSSRDIGLFKFFSTYSRYFNEIHKQEKLSVYFEIIEDAVVFVISDLDQYEKALVKFSKIPLSEDELKKPLRQLKEELLSPFDLGEPPYEICFSSKTINEKALENIVNLILSVVEGDYIVKKTSARKILVEFKSVEWFLNFFKNFHSRYLLERRKKKEVQ